MLGIKLLTSVPPKQIGDQHLGPAVASEFDSLRGQPYDVLQNVFLVCAAIWCLAFATRVGILWLTRSYLDPDPSEIVAIATSLATKGQFADAYGSSTGPTAHASPLYPWLLSLVFRIFGTGQTGEIAQEILSCALASMVWALMPLLGKVAQVNAVVGALAGVGGALLPINRAPETKGDFETALAGLMCVLVFVVYMDCWRRHSFSTKSALYMGIVSGLAILASASLAAMILGLLILVPLMLGRRLDGRRFLFPVTAILTILVILLPWAIRNYFALGSLVWTRSNFGIELNVSNNDQAQANWGDNGVAMKRYHPRANSRERDQLVAKGEIAYNRQKRIQASHWIAGHPKSFLWFVLRRVYYFWFPKMKRPVQTVAFAGITIGAILGLFLLYRRDRILAASFISVGLSYPLVYYIVQASPRYVYPLQWMFFLLTSWCVVEYAGRYSTPSVSLRKTAGVVPRP